MTRKKRRLILITVCGSVLALAVGLILFAMSGSIVFFRSPSEIEAQAIPVGTRLRLGGLVQDGSLKRGPRPSVCARRRSRHGPHPRRRPRRASRTAEPALQP